MICIFAVSVKSPPNELPILNASPVISRSAARSITGFTPFRRTVTSSVNVAVTGAVEFPVGPTFIVLGELELKSANSFPEFALIVPPGRANSSKVAAPGPTHEAAQFVVHVPVIVAWNVTACPENDPRNVRLSPKFALPATNGELQFEHAPEYPYDAAALACKSPVARSAAAVAEADRVDKPFEKIVVLLALDAV
jgi:hypothetical protein